MLVEGDSSQAWEIHTFSVAGPYTLDFASSELNSVTADCLIVAGGGGGGGSFNSAGSSYDRGGGGGAGGLLYKRVELPLVNGTVQIVVGGGGTGGAPQTQGNDGGNSSIGDIVVPGGGGGGAGGGETSLNGRAGGSGGGSGAGGSNLAGAVGKGKSNTNGNSYELDSEIKGNNGASANAYTDYGGGGGGAGSEGEKGNESSPTTTGMGGDPWVPADDALWLTDVAAVTTVNADYEFSRGGRGGLRDNSTGAPGQYPGDGGSADGRGQTPGASGHSGIVVIRFQRPADAVSE
jgi:hypothetical protein